MRRWIWLAATAALLIGVQAPLCALACLAGPEVEADAAAHPCHESGPESPASETPTSHDECGCELAPEVLVSASGDLASVANGMDAARGVSPERPRPDVVCRAALACDTDLPPPDLLLLNSTLLI